MDIIKAAQAAKQMGDSQLVQSMQGGMMPEFIAAAELQSRRRMRGGAGAPGGTVVQDILADVAPPPQPPPPQFSPPQMGPPPQGQPQMQGGGSVADALRRMPTEASAFLPQLMRPTPVAMPEAPGISAEDYLKAMLPELAAMKDRIKGRDKGRLSRAIMQAGLAMAAGNSPHAMQNIGAGGLAGLTGYIRDRDDTDAGLGQMAGLEQDLRKAQQSSADQAANRANENWRSRVSAAITDAQMAAQPIAAANQMAGEAARFNAMMPVYSAQADASTASAARTRGLAALDPFSINPMAARAAAAQGLLTPEQAEIMEKNWRYPLDLNAQTAREVASVRADASGGGRELDIVKDLWDSYYAIVKQKEDALKGTIAMFNPDAAEIMRKRIREEALQEIIPRAAARGVSAEAVMQLFGGSGQQSAQPQPRFQYDMKTGRTAPGR